MEVIEADIEQQILAGSTNAYGMNDTLEDEEKNVGW